VPAQLARCQVWVSCWHQFPHLISFPHFTDFSSIPLPAWCLPIPHFHWRCHAPNSAATITFTHSNNRADLVPSSWWGHTRTQRAFLCRLGPHRLVSSLFVTLLCCLGFHSFEYNYNFIQNNDCLTMCGRLPFPESPIADALMLYALHFPPSRGGLLACYHMVIISFPRFFPGNWRLGSEPADQKESIGTILKSQASNMGLNDFSRLPFLQHSSFSFLNENKHF